MKVEIRLQINCSDSPNGSTDFHYSVIKWIDTDKDKMSGEAEIAPPTGEDEATLRKIADIIEKEGILSAPIIEELKAEQKEIRASRRPYYNIAFDRLE